MSTKRTILGMLIVALAITLIVGAFLSVVTNQQVSGDGTYVESATTISAPPFKTATNGQISLKVNSVSDASNRTTSDSWITANGQAGLYRVALAPTREEQSLIANVTVSNVQRAPVPFTYTKFFLVDTQGSTYYANYAVCDRDCGASVLHNRTLNTSFTGDLYVLFSVPATADVIKLVYASNPPLEMVLT